MMRFLAGLIVQTLLVIALIMGPTWAMTGGFEWRRGWIAIAILFAASAISGLLLLITDPDLARERASVPRPQTRADALASACIAVSAMVLFVLPALDAHVLHLPALQSEISLLAGVIIFLGGLGVIAWTLRTNSFAAAVVKIQKERNQRVIDTGPYALVRHPMYMGGILFMAGLALILDSAATALLALPLLVAAFMPRMLVEEAVLRRDLPGYADYQSRVRARIVPGIF